MRTSAANPNVTLGASAIHGTGVFAARGLRAGSVVLDVDDSRLVMGDDPLRPGGAEHHCDYLGPGQTVLMQPPERHINHCCDPNAFVKTVGGTRRVIALRDIEAGGEVTSDYCVNGYRDTVWQCHCGAARRGPSIHLDIFHLPLELQREYLPLLEDWFVEWWRADVRSLPIRLGLLR